MMRTRFGAFELDTERIQLTKHGIAIPLRDQPLEVLMALLERPGEIVTREHLRQRLWSDRAFGDFEAGLNTAVSRLRQVLNDPAANSALIETVPKRGYRFIAKVASSSTQTYKPEAHAAYLRAIFLARRHTTENIARALEYFDEAMRLNPDWALPYHGASTLHVVTALIGVVPPCRAMAQAEQLAARGSELEPDSAVTHNALAFLRMFQWRWSEAETAHRLAIALAPNDPRSHATYAHHCSFHARHGEALQEAHKALELAPVDSLMNFRVVQCFYYARRYEDAVRSARKTIELAPEFPNTYGYLAQALVAMEQFEEAWRIAERGRTLGAGHPIIEGIYGYVAGVMGRTAEAMQVRRDLEERRKSGYGPALPIGWTYLGLGDTEGYLDCLEVAFDEREPFLASMCVFPGSDRVRNDRRFARLSLRLGFTH
jgi:DNA-binding winged helix-turn-helix (wHTH) protein/Flp pilus assembly protein TadD